MSAAEREAMNDAYREGVEHERNRILTTLRHERWVWMQDERTPERQSVIDTLRLMIRQIEGAP